VPEDPGEPGPPPGPIQTELHVLFEDAMNRVGYYQRLEAGDDSPMTDGEYRILVLAGMEWQKNACLQLAAEIDGLWIAVRGAR
jgi:hypothetical protein